MIVVKVGGSLFDHPGLGPGLRAWRAGIGESVLFVPGGGEMAEVVRKWDTLHGLGNETSHRLAVKAMAMGGKLLKSILGCEVFDSETILQDESLPQSWAVTSDSIAAHVALKQGAQRLVLLKSGDLPAETHWPEAAAKGWVDEYFPTIASRLTCPIEVVNFRRWLQENGFGN
jgi:aspartokinase-like uncharacterized kinase